MVEIVYAWAKARWATCQNDTTLNACLSRMRSQSKIDEQKNKTKQTSKQTQTEHIDMLMLTIRRASKEKEVSVETKFCQLTCVNDYFKILS